MSTDSSDECEYDLGNLLVTDPRPLDPSKLGPLETKEKYLLDVSTENVQKLMNNIFQLPRTNTNEGVFASLPPPETDLPREKRIPEPKKPSKWKEFVKKKGLRFQPKTFWQYDETSDEFRPRVGPGAVKEKKQPIVEFKPGDDPSDPFGDNKKKKSLGKRKRDETGSAIESLILPPTESSDHHKKYEPPKKKRRIGDTKKRAGKGKRLRKNEGDPEVFYLPTHDPKRLTDRARNVVATSYEIVKSNTASMGLFDKKLKGEKSDLKSRNSKFSKFRPVGTYNQLVPDIGSSQKSGNSAGPPKSIEILNRVLKEGEKRRKQVSATSNLIWQKEFEREKTKERKKSLIEQKKMKFKIRTKKRGGKKNKKLEYVKK